MPARQTPKNRKQLRARLDSVRDEGKAGSEGGVLLDVRSSLILTGLLPKLDHGTPNYTK